MTVSNVWRRVCAIGLGACGALAGVPAQGQITLGPPVSLSPGPQASLGQEGVALARSPHGISLAVWSDARTGDHDVYGALIGDDGRLRSVSGGFRIAGAPGTHEGDPRVAVCGGVFLVVWGNGFNDGTITDLYATRVTTAGVVLDASPIVISNSPGVQHNSRQFDSDGVDTFLVPFRDASATVFGGINFMRVSASTGITLDPPGGAALAPGNPAEGIKKNPSAAFGAGRFLVTWDDQRDLCQYPGEAGCIDIYGCMVDPASGLAFTPPFPTTRAFSCQEGSRAVFDGLDFFVAHHDERRTNCSTADIYAERVDVSGVVLDPVDFTGMVGGLLVAGEAPQFPPASQTSVFVASSGVERVVSYADQFAGAALSVRRVIEDGRLEVGEDALQVAINSLGIGTPAPGVNPRLWLAHVSYTTYLSAYVLNGVPTARLLTFATPFRRMMLTGLVDPKGVAVDAAGQIYIADAGNARIVVLDANGTLVRVIGKRGTGNGQFQQPFGVAVDARGTIFVLDTGNRRVQVFNAQGHFVRAWTGAFNSPFGIAVDAGGKVYIADTGNNRVAVFNAYGSLVRRFGTAGSALGQFRAPRAIALDALGNIYVADRDNNRVQVFNPGGQAIREIRPAGGLREPRGVAVDALGRIYIADSQNSRVVVTSNIGSPVYRFGSLGSQPGQFSLTWALALDPAGNIYVAELNNDRVQVFGALP